MIEKQEAKLVYLPTDQMLADILTKGLPSPRVKILNEKLGVY